MGQKQETMRVYLKVQMYNRLERSQICLAKVLQII